VFEDEKEFKTLCRELYPQSRSMSDDTDDQAVDYMITDDQYWKLFEL